MFWPGCCQLLLDWTQKTPPKSLRKGWINVSSPLKYYKVNGQDKCKQLRASLHYSIASSHSLPLHQLCPKQEKSRVLSTVAFSKLALKQRKTNPKSALCVKASNIKNMDMKERNVHEKPASHMHIYIVHIHIDWPPRKIIFVCFLTLNSESTKGTAALLLVTFLV